VNRTQLSAAVLLLSLVAGCSGPSQPSSTSTGSVTPSSATTTVSLSPAEQDAQAAEQAVVAFWQKIDELGSDPKKSLEELAEVARDQARIQWQRNLTVERGQGYRQTGSASVIALNSEYAVDGLYSVTACIDFSGVNVVDQAGQSVITASRQPQASYTYKVQQDGGSFYVVEDTMEASPC
jgi:hypothetical protein